MAVELIRLKVGCYGQALRLLNGSVIVHADGFIDFLGDTVAFAEDISQVIGAIDGAAPMRRVRPEDLAMGGDGNTLLVDVVRVGEQRIVGPLLLTVGGPVAVGGAIDAAMAAVIGRDLRSHGAVRAAGQPQDGLAVAA